MENRLITYKERVLYYKIIKDIEEYLKTFAPTVAGDYIIEEPDIDFVTDIIHAISKYPYRPDKELEAKIEQYGYAGQKCNPNPRPSK